MNLTNKFYKKKEYSIICLKRFRFFIKFLKKPATKNLILNKSLIIKI